MPADSFFAGFDPNARRVYLAHASSFTTLQQSAPPAEGAFVLFLGSDATATTAELNAAATTLLGLGAVYVLTWGNDCERVKQAFDDAIATRNADPAAPTIMTTAHPDESIVVALTFAADFAAPAEEFDVQAMLIAIVGSIDLFDEARGCLEALLEDEAPIASG